jgi:hypothetical protein
MLRRWIRPSILSHCCKNIVAFATELTLLEFQRLVVVVRSSLEIVHLILNFQIFAKVPKIVEFKTSIVSLIKIFNFFNKLFIAMVVKNILLSSWVLRIDTWTHSYFLTLPDSWFPDGIHISFHSFFLNDFGLLFFW